MRDWAISCIIASNTPGAGDFTPFPSERTLPIRDHKVSSNSDKFTKNFSRLDRRVGRPGGRSESDPSPQLESPRQPNRGDSSSDATSRRRQMTTLVLRCARPTGLAFSRMLWLSSHRVSLHVCFVATGAAKHGDHEAADADLAQACA